MAKGNGKAARAMDVGADKVRVVLSVPREIYKVASILAQIEEQPVEAFFIQSMAGWFGADCDLALGQLLGHDRDDLLKIASA